jgi:glycosyltransferase involved in cell wall biosynthesis
MNLGNSLAVSKEMVEVARCPPKKCRTILNGVDLSRFRPDLPRIFREEMGWQADQIVVGMVANFRPCKRHADFLEAAAIIRKLYPETRFVMVGADNGNMAEIATRVKALGLEQSVAMLGSQSRPERIFAAIDIYVCTSDTEGFSNVLLEALACGKPVIATRVGGNQEVIRDGDNGFLVPPKSPELVARALEKLLAQPNLRVAMGNRGRNFAEAKFSLKRMVDEHERLYKELISEHVMSAV